MEKRGQFFLVAALVISGILIGLAGIYTQVSSPEEDLAVYDLSSELDYESLQVIDQGVYTDLTQDEINSNIINLTEYYVNTNPENDFLIVYGNQERIVVKQYKSARTGAVGASTGGSPIVTETVQERTVETSSPNIVGENIEVHFGDDLSLDFNLRHGQNFFSVIQANSNEQSYVARNPRR